MQGVYTSRTVLQLGISSALRSEKLVSITVVCVTDGPEADAPELAKQFLRCLELVRDASAEPVRVVPWSPEPDTFATPLTPLVRLVGGGAELESLRAGIITPLDSRRLLCRSLRRAQWGLHCLAVGPEHDLRGGAVLGRQTLELSNASLLLGLDVVVLLKVL